MTIDIGLASSPRRRMAACLVLACFVGGCASPSRDRLPPSPQVVGVAMKEYRFVYRTPVKPGRVVFRLRNTGRLNHEFWLYDLPSDMPPLNDQIHGSNHRFVPFLVQLAPIGPQADQTISLDLESGHRYGMVCFVPEKNTNHGLEGMNSEFRVGPKATSPPAA